LFFTIFCFKDNKARWGACDLPLSVFCCW